MERLDDGILFKEGNKKIAFYHKDASTNLDRGRTNYFHPVYLPDGTVITENAPEDHLHHRGIFWAWHRVLLNGKQLGDEWMMENFIQDVKSVEFLRMPGDIGSFKTTIDWKSSDYLDGKQPFVEEKADVMFYPQKKNYRIIQFEISLKALVDHLQIAGSDDVKGYGGFSVRMKLPENVTFTSSDGAVEPKNEAVSAGDYVDIAGSVAKDAGQGGVLIYSANDFATADQWILRKARSMQNAVWPGREPVDLSTTEPTMLKYTVVLYSGEINEQNVLRELRKLSWEIK
ncbi:MAG TPA: DUF6807 family protein [Sunxiuqinia sp.]|nr:DUF6807 family protein [Sunxiuqinia sp.]